MPQAFSPILDFRTTANTYGLDQNCYYCSVAALSNKTVEEYFRISEIMQQDTATPEEIIALWAEGNVANVAYERLVDGNTFDQQIQPMPLGSGLGLAYSRQDGSGHMVVIAKDDHGGVQCIDYQQNPPAFAGFPPEENIVDVFVFYKLP